MKFLPLIWATLFHKRARTLLTLLSILTAFLLFGFLDSVRIVFTAGSNVAGADRLITASRFSIIQPLPKAHLAQISSIPGVKTVAWAQWFGGVYQDSRNFFPNFAISPAEYLEVHSEVVLTEQEKRAFLENRTAAIAGKRLAERFGWKVGDRITLNATIFPKKDGSLPWEFELVGIFTGREEKDAPREGALLFSYDYFDEARQFGQGTVGNYIIQVESPEQAAEVAVAIDKRFSNSDSETKTQSEKDFQLGFAKQFGDIGLIVTAIMVAVFFTILLLTGNTMSQSVRERIPQLAVLKTLGFSNERVLSLVLVESVMLAVLGGVLGMLLAGVLLPGIAKAAPGAFPPLVVSAQSWANGLVIASVLGLVVGLPPALKAMRLRIVDALAGK